MNYINDKIYLDTILEILNDSDYNNWIKLIDEDGENFANSNEINASVALDHGSRHARIVAENIAKLLYQYGSDEKEIFLGYVAGLLHDIGITKGKEGHAKTGHSLASQYLQKFKIFSDSDKNIILNAILYHGNGGNLITPIDAFISISDKLDFTNDRIIKSKFINNSKIKEILSNDINIKDNKLIISYKVTENFDNSAFYTVPKTIDIPIKIGEWLKLDTVFYINGKNENFEDRLDYKGYIYGK